ncbi:MAG TPA: nucleoside triphosphate pyrophosphohydrolase [Terriglobales bacterium]|nr:nucleoside triphosphate pyrophosphohydrolase [Terriglobales bacterium]
MTAKRKSHGHEGSHERSARKRRAAIRTFSANRGLMLATQDGILLLKDNEVSAKLVGWKAFGLTCLPPEWVPPFFVVDSGFARNQDERPNLRSQIRECLGNLKLEESRIMVRSSGATETIEDRGRLVSEACKPEDASEIIEKLSKKLSDLGIRNVHWIVQRNISPARKGHLSNERRLSREPRDFVAEFELKGELPGYTVPIAVRHWRDGDELADFDLACSSEAGTSLKLRKVALWASALPSRILFEWVWSGSQIWVVQADLARPAQGVDPNTLRPKEIPEISAKALKVFRAAKAKDFKRYRKLRNAKLYSDLGYRMPTFYVLDDPAIIQRILRGTIPDSLEDDLKQLTLRPLMIRTDGVDIPSDKREMLPRSEDMRTPTEAKQWLVKGFSEEVKRIAIAGLPVALIAHHFIPSIAAAWARSDPGNSIVRIESLWGLPEGLYWHSHDTFEIDTKSRFPTRKRLRFKGTFVAPDDSGRWVHYRTNAPFDWGRSIAKKEWLSEIAKTTQKIAENEKRALTVMWFIDNDARATPHKILPWYHTDSAISTPKAAPRRKLTMASDFKLETGAQWEELKSAVRSGKRIERVMLEPKDPDLVRNPKFAKELAEFAAAQKIVIELAGGILSHAYHMLQRHGAQVECIDLFGAEEEDVEYNKLVRDKVPSMIKRKGEDAEVVRLKGEALLAALRQKLVEESYEALDARAGDDLIGELADVQEVTQAILESLQIPTDQLDAQREEKRRRRGGFRRGLMLKRTSTPHTLSKKLIVERYPSLPAKGLPDAAVIDRSALLPSNRPYRRPDRRNVDYQPEGLLTFETEISRLGTTKQSAVFEIPINENETRTFRVSVDLERDHSSLWGQVRLKLEPSQLTMRLTPEAQMELNFQKNEDKK